MANQNELVTFGIKEYVLVHDNINAISGKVSEKLTEGYVVYGQPFNSNGGVCQPMVKLDEKMIVLMQKALDVLFESI